MQTRNESLRAMLLSHVRGVCMLYAQLAQVFQAATTANWDVPQGMYGWDNHSTQNLTDDVTLGLVPEDRLTEVPFFGSPT